MKKKALSMVWAVGGGVLFLIVLAIWLSGCAGGGETGVLPLAVPDFKDIRTLPINSSRLPGVWVLKSQNTPSYCVYTGLVCSTKALYNWILLSNPLISGDRVYIEDKEGEELPTFFFRDQLTMVEKPVYKVLEGARSYSEDPQNGVIFKEDNYSWEEHQGGTFPYLMDISSRIKDNHPGRIYLTNDEVPVQWIKDGNWVHFFLREDVILLNP